MKPCEPGNREMYPVELVDVWKSYDERNFVLKEVNLKVRRGEFISIRGKSGIGKTTLLRLIGLLDTPTKGEVLFYGRRVSGLRDEEASELRLRRIGFVFQFFNLIPSLTVLENIELPMSIAGFRKRERRERAFSLLEKFKLENLAYRMPDEISGGEKQRIAIIRALANKPEIIVADEPTANLDEENTFKTLNLLKEINEERNVTIILATTSFLEEIPSHRNYTLKNGELIEIEI